MTRRVAIAILLTVWTLLIVGGAVAYWTTRAVLLDDLDASIVARAGTLPELTGAAGNDLRPAEYARDRYLIEDERGHTVARVGRQERSQETPAVLGRRFATLADGRRLRSLTLKAHLAGETDAPERIVTIVYSAPADAFDAALSRLAAALTTFGLLSGAAAAAVAVLVARRALAPLRSTAATLATIDESSLNQNIDTAALPVEIRPVVDRLNQMLAKLSGAFAVRRRFLADASHELRTPVAALVTSLEVALSRPRGEERLREVIHGCLADATQLRHLVERLLQQVRGENFEGDGPAESIDLDPFLATCASPLAPIAQHRGVRLGQSLASKAQLRSQPHRLRSVIVNLLGNAIEHNKPGGHVDLISEVTPSCIAITIRDDGPGIAGEHLPHLFEPFYRASASRDDQHHLGLGLFLVHTHVQALGAAIKLDSSVGVGTTARIEIPLESLESRQDIAPPAVTEACLAKPSS
jgi:signal transduction histidine kinase